MGIITGGTQLTGGAPIEGTGSVNPLKHPGVPVDGASGTYAGRIAAGGFVYDITNDDLYENTGTSAVPVYGKVDA